MQIARMRGEGVGSGLAAAIGGVCTVSMLVAIGAASGLMIGLFITCHHVTWGQSCRDFQYASRFLLGGGERLFGPGGRMTAVSRNPWWHSNQDNRGWDEPLPPVVVLSPDYSADLPLWGKGFGNIAWQFTKFPPQLLDRLAAWQQDFEHNHHYDTGWRSAAIRDRWARDAKDLARDVQAALGARAELVLDLWPLQEST